MVTSPQSFTVVDQLVREAQEDQSVIKKKANTVTASVGTTATVIAAGLSAWVEAGTGVPSWITPVVFIVGMIATVFGVSKTKNGVTDSVVGKLNDTLAKKIDATHFDHVEATLDYGNQVIDDSFERFNLPDSLREPVEEGLEGLLKFAHDAREGRV